MKTSNPTHDLIYSTTIDIVAQDCLSILTLSKVAEQSELKEKVITDYFSDRRALINSVFVYLKNKFTAEVYSEVRAGDPLLENFKKVYLAYFLSRFENTAEHYFLDQCRASPEYLDEKTLLLEEQTYQGVIGLIEQGKKEHVIKYTDSAILLHYSIGGIKEVITQMKKHELPYDEVTAATIFDLCYSTMRK